eukprot:gnl/MRDRNA2_/MRDRNA2_309196_c0_seq1.p1 gnl/MRDRNA2_/MRDRNA2_309196_c0~~gnl/MRDRNA2_/MRDRNA2_309196_c0_seq1.p1  ORF type:complete len:262 (-),score=50.15 gnl/MRDRNA2_/MRDRNA2_309196_c0_seq1:299-1048(-)
MQHEHTGIGDAGWIRVGGTLGALAVLQEGDFESQVSVLSAEFCELTVLRKKDFLSVVSERPLWDETLKKISSALYISKNRTELLRHMAEGNDEVLGSILSIPQPKENGSNAGSNPWQRAKNNIRAVRHFQQTLSYFDSSNFEDDGYEEVQRAKPETFRSEATREARNEGSQTIEMSQVERQIMTELSRVSSKLDKVHEETASRLEGQDQRVHAMEKRFNVHLERLTNSLQKIEQRLDARPANDHPTTAL